MQVSAILNAAVRASVRPEVSATYRTKKHVKNREDEGKREEVRRALKYCVRDNRKLRLEPNLCTECLVFF